MFWVWALAKQYSDCVCVCVCVIWGQGTGYERYPALRTACQNRLPERGMCWLESTILTERANWTAELAHWPKSPQRPRKWMYLSVCVYEHVCVYTQLVQVNGSYSTQRNACWLSLERSGHCMPSLWDVCQCVNLWQGLFGCQSICCTCPI